MRRTVRFDLCLHDLEVIENYVPATRTPAHTTAGKINGVSELLGPLGLGVGEGDNLVFES
jgi:hypothetical protein